MSNSLRVRWAAIGAAVAVSLGGGTMLIASASNNVGASSFSPVVPIRVLDTRAEGKIGALDGLGDPRTLQVTGTIVTEIGTQTVVPIGATAVVMNVTVVDGEAGNSGGYVTVYPCGTRPTASNLNFSQGQTIPNAVTTAISSSGHVCFYVYGKANLLADIVGYYQTMNQNGSQSGTRVIDSAGHDIGQLISVFPGGYYDLFIINVSDNYFYIGSDGTIADEIYFSNTNCEGDAYVSIENTAQYYRDLPSNRMYLASGVGSRVPRFFVPTYKNLEGPTLIQSVLTDDANYNTNNSSPTYDGIGNCQSFPPSNFFWPGNIPRYGRKVKEISPPIELSLDGPLSIKTN